jgi:hypothetical protein
MSERTPSVSEHMERQENAGPAGGGMFRIAGSRPGLDKRRLVQFAPRPFFKRSHDVNPAAAVQNLAVKGVYSTEDDYLTPWQY